MRAADQTTIAYEVAKSLVSVYLTALQNYRPESAERLAMTVQEAALSVQHAEETLKQFGHFCPTPDEIRETAFNLRSQFQPQPAQVKQWEAAGYTKGPVGTSYYNELMKDRKPGDPPLQEQMWKAIKEKLKVAEFSQVPIGECWDAAEKLGFPLNRCQHETMEAWRSRQPKEPFK